MATSLLAVSAHSIVVNISQPKAVLVGSLALLLLQNTELMQLFLSIIPPINAAIQQTGHQKQKPGSEQKQKHFFKMSSGELRREDGGT